MLLILYHLLGAAVVAILGLLAPFVPTLRHGLAERFGRVPGNWWPPAGDAEAAETIWIHAASVGEVRAAAPLVGELLRQRPAARILVSTFTASGRRIAAQTLAVGEPRVRCLLLPLDWGWIPRRVISRERPALFVLLETELWPVLLTALRRARVPVLIANGRISPRSFGRYRLVRRALRPVLEAITLALVRTADDAWRYQSIGLPASRVRVAGNLKHARRQGGDPAGERRQAAIRERLHGGAGRKVLIAGSVRGCESDLVLAAFRRLRGLEPALLLVLAPRHPARFDVGKFRAWPGAWVRWSAAPRDIDPETAVVILDTLGELADFYAAADVALVGGTWGDHGGHNLLEPAYHGVPVVFGPDIRHVEDEGRALLAAGGGFSAGDVAELFERCRGLLADRGARDAAGSRALEAAMTFSGAIETVARAAHEILEDLAKSRHPGENRGPGELPDRHPRRTGERDMIGGFVSRLERIWYPSAGSGTVPPAALHLAAALHGLATRARNGAYDRGIFAARHLPVPCISVGNLSVGGTGKTPLVVWLIDELTARGERPAVVSRGYGGSARGPVRVTTAGGCEAARRFGDEPALLAAHYPEVPVVVGRDRHAAGLLAVNSWGATVVVADDAFQHRRLARDMNIVVLDASRGLGNGYQLPAGPLREAPVSVARAGFVVLNQVGAAPDLEGLRRTVARLAPRAAIAEADLVFVGWRDARTGAPVELPAGAVVYAFSGIANPGSFHRTLEALGMSIKGGEVFRDHHPYGAGEIGRLQRETAASGAVAAVTTAKDAVRIPGWSGAVPLYRAEVKLAMIRGHETLWETLKSIVARGGG